MGNKFQEDQEVKSKGIIQGASQNQKTGLREPVPSSKEDLKLELGRTKAESEARKIIRSSEHEVCLNRLNYIKVCLQPKATGVLKSLGTIS